MASDNVTPLFVLTDVAAATGCGWSRYGRVHEVATSIGIDSEKVASWMAGIDDASGVVIGRG